MSHTETDEEEKEEETNKKGLGVGGGIRTTRIIATTRTTTRKQKMEWRATFRIHVSLFYRFRQMTAVVVDYARRELLLCEYFVVVQLKLSRRNSRRREEFAYNVQHSNLLKHRLCLLNRRWRRYTAQYTPPTRRDCFVASASAVRTQFATTADGFGWQFWIWLNRLHSVWLHQFW